jgi:hypothetical protein
MLKRDSPHKKKKKILSAFARSGHSNDQKEAESKGYFRPKGVIHNWPPSKPRFPDQFRQPLINQRGSMYGRGWLQTFL